MSRPVSIDDHDAAQFADFYAYLRADHSPESSRALAAYEKETLALFGDDEKYADAARRLLAAYPDYAYHQKAHGLDVMRAVTFLVDAINGPQRHDNGSVVDVSISDDERRLLQFAAIGHDAELRFGHDLMQSGHSQFATAEALAAHVTVNALENIDANAATRPVDGTADTLEPRGVKPTELVTEAILGTQLQAGDRTVYGKLLRHADLWYVWGASEQRFQCYATRCWLEVFPWLTWKEFQETQPAFLKGYRSEMERELRTCGVPETTIQKFTDQINQNIKYITNNDTHPLTEDELRAWPTLEPGVDLLGGQQTDHRKQLGAAALAA